MSLHLGLTEPAVFLRHSSDIAASGRRRQVSAEDGPSIIRGVVTLKVPKRTRIKNIEVFLTGTVATEWPEGIGPRRVEISEEHTILSARAVIFKAGETTPEPGSRRARSLGPGVQSAFDSDDDSDEEEERGRRRLQTSREPSISRSPSPDSGFEARRGVSVDQLGRHRYPGTELPAYYNASPVYSPQPSLHNLPEEQGGPSQTLEGLRNDLRSMTDRYVQSPGIQGARSPSGIRTAPSSRPATSRPPSLRRPSQYMESLALSPTASRLDSASSRLEEAVPSPPANSQRRPSFSRVSPGAAGSSRPTSATPVFSDPSPSGTPKTSALGLDEGSASRRDRSRNKRFSFGAAWHEVKELVKPAILRPGVQNDQSLPGNRTSTSRPPSLRESGAQTESRKRDSSRGRDRTVVGKLSSALGLEEDRKDGEWKEFKKGTYNWPVSFVIPPDSPPSIRCDYGSVTYRIRAQATRAGTFTSKLVANTEVAVISCPSADDLEESESIIVEREWDNNLRYLISLSGKSFPLGGTIPVQLTLMPLSKICIYRLSVVLEEKVDYYAHQGKTARHEPARRWEILSIKDPDKYTPLLPIFSDSTDAALRSPLARHIDEDDPSAAAGQILNPTGPWSFRFSLKVPDCTTRLHFTNKYTKAKIVVTHHVKIIMRVDRGDNSELDAKGKRKQFDIIVEAPIQLLSCRCNPEWMSLVSAPDPGGLPHNANNLRYIASEHSQHIPYSRWKHPRTHTPVFATPSGAKAALHQLITSTTISNLQLRLLEVELCGLRPATQHVPKQPINIYRSTRNHCLAVRTVLMTEAGNMPYSFQEVKGKMAKGLPVTNLLLPS
ncbi:hypothetical protein FRC04_008626 [Tulasnella sp. 424]|nr:hypothetical protein FRC04_008626 [Tulasnella sp. 424]KAG8970756.1 hypothetical protein FRC05_011707 [Tulasnella sp. 425]